MRALVGRHPVLACVVVAYAVSWEAWTPLLVRGALVALIALACNFGAATQAARGGVGNVTTTCVMVWAAVLVVQELRRHERPFCLLVQTAVPAGGARERGRPHGAGARPVPRNGAP